LPAPVKFSAETKMIVLRQLNLHFQCCLHYDNECMFGGDKFFVTATKDFNRYGCVCLIACLLVCVFVCLFCMFVLYLYVYVCICFFLIFCNSTNPVNVFYFRVLFPFSFSLSFHQKCFFLIISFFFF